jgi:DNA modification methylase
MLCLTEKEVKTVGKIQPGTLVHGDCLTVMPYIPDGTADAIIADLPYG